MAPVLVVGNSHARIAERQMKNDPRLAFLAAPGGIFKSVTVVNDRLVSDDSEALNYFPPQARDYGLRVTDYRAIVVYGLQMIAQGKGDQWISFCQSSARYSEGCMARAYTDSLDASAGMHLLGKLRGQSVPIYAVPSPFPSEGHPLARIAEAPAASVLAHLKGEFQSRVEASGATPIWLPDELIHESGYLVRAAFASHRDGDFAHMNEAATELLIRHVVEVVDS